MRFPSIRLTQETRRKGSSRGPRRPLVARSHSHRKFREHKHPRKKTKKGRTEVWRGRPSAPRARAIGARQASGLAQVRTYAKPMLASCVANRRIRSPVSRNVPSASCASVQSLSIASAWRSFSFSSRPETSWRATPRPAWRRAFIVKSSQCIAPCATRNWMSLERLQDWAARQQHAALTFEASNTAGTPR